jgi:hypothetical protein
MTDKEVELEMSGRSNACGHGENGGLGESGTGECNGHIEVVPAKMELKEMAIRVGKKMVCLPLTYATLLGIIYSLIAGRYGRCCSALIPFAFSIGFSFV